MRAASRLPLAFALAVVPTFLPAAALAHVGNVPAKALFYLPPPPVQLPSGDGGLRWSYVPAEADKHYLLAWTDGDNDPTGRFTLRYVDHVIPTAATADFVDATNLDGTPTGGKPLGEVVRDTGGREARDIYVGCACARQDAAAVLLDGGSEPQCFDGGARWCDNALDWDTSLVPDGVYWIYAVNTDPPFHIFNVSEAPVRVRHGAHRAPIAIVVRPGAAGSSGDASYRGAVLVDGEAPLTLDLAYGSNDPDHWQEPLAPIAAALPATPSSDGSVAFDWDTSKVAEGTYFIGVTVHDATGAATSTSSRNGMTITHRGDMAKPGSIDLGGGSVTDLSAAVSDAILGPAHDHDGGCGCRVGARPRSATSSWLAALLLLGAMARLSPRGPRRGSRSGCTR